MTENEMAYHRKNLTGVMAYLSELSKEPDDAADQYRKAVKMALNSIEKMNNELTDIANQFGIVIQKGENNRHIVNKGTMTITFGK